MGMSYIFFISNSAAVVLVGKLMDWDKQSKEVTDLQ